MARAAEIDLDPNEPFALAAARVVRMRAGELFVHAEGVLDTSDIERLHDMRVASRRLRAVLEIFSPCFPRGDLKRVLRDVKALANALGERRDPDVHIAAMEAFAREIGPAGRPGVDALLARLRERQAHGNEALAAALEQAREGDLRGRLLALADGAAKVAG